MSSRGAVDLKLVSKKPLMVLWMGFRISQLGLLSRFRTANGPGPFRKANRRAQQLGGPRPRELWLQWLIDLKSWVLTISELTHILDALKVETYYEYQAWGERRTSPDNVADL